MMRPPAIIDLTPEEGQTPFSKLLDCCFPPKAMSKDGTDKTLATEEDSADSPADGLNTTIDTASDLGSLASMEADETEETPASSTGHAVAKVMWVGLMTSLFAAIWSDGFQKLIHSQA